MVPVCFRCLHSIPPIWTPTWTLWLFVCFVLCSLLFVWQLAYKKGPMAFYVVETSVPAASSGLRLPAGAVTSVKYTTYIWRNDI
jgi:hypothetical protein